MSNLISFRPDPDVQKKLDEVSAKDGRSISNLIDYILKLYFKLQPINNKG